MEKTLILIKPDAVHKGHIGEVIRRIEDTGLKLVGIKMIGLSNEILSDHYAHLTDKPFFPEIVKFMQASPVIAMVWEGEGSIVKMRDLAGVTDSTKADPGTIRGDLGTDIQYNLIHASDSPEASQDEVGRFFSESELYSYTREPEKFQA